MVPSHPAAPHEARLFQRVGLGLMILFLYRMSVFLVSALGINVFTVILLANEVSSYDPKNKNKVMVLLWPIPEQPSVFFRYFK